jgi:hypothetical protein
VIWLLYFGINERHWFGLAVYAILSMIGILFVSFPMVYLWDDHSAKQPFDLKNIEPRKILPFVGYNLIFNFFIVCFVAMVTVRTPWFTNSFALILPLVGIVMTFALAALSLFKIWSWGAWVNKIMATSLVGFVWVFLSLLYAALPDHPRSLWITSCVLYCIFCPIYYSVTAYYFDTITPVQSRGFLRGLVMACSGPLLFTLDSWIKHGSKHGYLAFDFTNLVCTTVASVAAMVFLQSNAISAQKSQK